MFKYFLYQLGLFCIRRLPTKFSYLLANILSDIQYCLSFRDRSAVIKNLKCILAEKDGTSSMVRDVFRNFGKYLVEFFQMNKTVNKQFIKERVHFTGMEYLDKILKEGKGGIVITAHIGNWELGAVLLS